MCVSRRRGEHTLSETQPELEFPPRTHRDDPGSSREAEVRTRKTWGRKHADLMRELGLSPGVVATELTRICCGRHWPTDFHPRLCEVRKRLSDLRTCKPPRVRHTAGYLSRLARRSRTQCECSGQGVFRSGLTKTHSDSSTSPVGQVPLQPRVHRDCLPLPALFVSCLDAAVNRNRQRV